MDNVDSHFPEILQSWLVHNIKICLHRQFCNPQKLGLIISIKLWSFHCCSCHNARVHISFYSRKHATTEDQQIYAVWIFFSSPFCLSLEIRGLGKQYLEPSHCYAVHYHIFWNTNTFLFLPVTLVKMQKNWTVDRALWPQREFKHKNTKKCFFYPNKPQSR